MEMFHIQLALLAGLLLAVIYFAYNKKKVKQLSEELLDKKIVINELAEHANKIEKEITSVSVAKPKTTKSNKAKSKTTISAKGKKPKVEKSEKVKPTKAKTKTTKK